MFAVVKTGGKQYKANLGEVLEVEKLEGNPGDKIELSVLAAANDLEGKTKVVAEIIAQKKAPKVLIFKKRRRKNSQRKNGHRQQLTALRIVEIGDNKYKAEPKKAPAKAEKTENVEKKAAKPATEKKAEKKSEDKAEKKPAAKKESKPAAKKPAAKKKETE
ncbi:MAG: 50S ribosomal protein L21 [Alphaproteobacteria bacterium CG11_big_fil_rev_8_21_14_0_20_44_7]|nr:MAG: 50S ribosomal protein L21 [Alphaproteobacteria bacterium CG11_big_fil_rev_8_21_14_0_20_44_7]